MKKFIFKLSLFITPLILGSFILDYTLSNKLKQSKTIASGEYSVWNDIFNGNINAEILIQGSSRAWVHFDPAIIADSTGLTCYNIGIDGHHFFMQNLRQEILQKYNKKPKLIIYSLETGTLSKRDDLYNLNQFLPYLIKYKKDLKNLLSFNGFNKYDFELPLVRYYGNFVVIGKLLASSMNENNIEGRVRGFQGQNATWNHDLDKAKSKFTSIEVKIDTSTVHLFRDYIKKCKRDSIQIVFVYAPEYIEGQKFISNRQKIIKLYQQLSEEYKIPFLDFSTDELSYKKQYFYNSRHMNKEGAELFTQKLIDIMKEQELFPKTVVKYQSLYLLNF